ncbi:MAG: tRNA dihydrouridine synthase DusB [Lachnospiraceae bacterium]|nr:tRNA dihydrouridine synthase DusB [Lachnospiraceae bacterium]
MKSVSIGNVNIDVPLFLGPMAGITDLPFRILCRECGCGLTYSEMISAKGLYYKNSNTEELMRTDPADSPFAIQLFGSDPGIMAEMAHAIEPREFDILDINMGCPVPKVVNNGEGSALMKDPDLICRIVKSISESIEKPVTVKLRKGFDAQHVNAVEASLAAQEGGAKAVCIHGRTRSQYYGGDADWGIVADVKAALDIPVIGSGDVTDGESTLKMFSETGCDAVMIARAARGDPWIFGRIRAFLETGGEPEKPGDREVRDMIIRHAEMVADMKGEYIAVREMRKHVAWYVTGRRNAVRIRTAVNQVTDMKGLRELIETIGKEQIPQG